MKPAAASVRGVRRSERVRAQSGLDVSTGASACRAALEQLGGRRIAELSPYQAGFTVVRFKGLHCPTATSTAEVGEAPLRRILADELNGPDVEAIVQVGTNLSMVRLADEAERWPGKPVVAINAVTL